MKVQQDHQNLAQESQ